MTSLSPKMVERLAAEAKEEATPATHADVEKYIIAICREIGEDGLSNASAALLVLLEETIEMLSWDEADLPSRESLTWE